MLRIFCPFCDNFKDMDNPVLSIDAATQKCVCEQCGNIYYMSSSISTMNSIIETMLTERAVK